MCKCVLYYCHQVTTQLQLTNIYHIMCHVIEHFTTRTHWFDIHVCRGKHFGSELADSVSPKFVNFLINWAHWLKSIPFLQTLIFTCLDMLMSCAHQNLAKVFPVKRERERGGNVNSASNTNIFHIIFSLRVTCQQLRRPIKHNNKPVQLISAT